MRHPLTPELIIAKTKTESLHLVKNLNLWGNNIDDLKVLK
jgi:hypothetical protein